MINAPNDINFEPDPDPPPTPPLPPPSSTRREWLPWAIGGIVAFLLMVACWPSSKPCPRCGGSGQVRNSCSNCGGSGKTGFIFKDPCRSCGGAGSIGSACQTCQGTGKIKN